MIFANIIDKRLIKHGKTVSCQLQYSKLPKTKVLILLSASPAISKFYHPSCMVIKNIAILTILFSARNFKTLTTRHMEFFGVSNLRNYVSVIVTISNITGLVSHKVLCFQYFMHMIHGVNKKDQTAVCPTCPPSP